MNDVDSSTALHVASNCGYVPVIEALVEGGVRMNNFDKSAQTALHVAARYGRHTVMEVLNVWGASVNDLLVLGTSESLR